MSKLTQRPRIDLNVSLSLSESEVRALDALAGYGSDGFLKVFYTHMGEHYMRPHEAGLRSLFDTIRKELPPIMTRMDAAKKAFCLDQPVVRSRAEHEAMIAMLKADATPTGGVTP